MKLSVKSRGASTWMEPLYMLADSIQIEQVVLNLCTNAWQAMGEVGGRIEVGIGRAEAAAAVLFERPAAGRHINLWVADDGAGMDEATRQRAFDPFFSTKGPAKGTGLGLSICYSIIKDHGGTIEIDSEKDKGTRFTIKIPV